MSIEDDYYEMLLNKYMESIYGGDTKDTKDTKFPFFVNMGELFGVMKAASNEENYDGKKSINTEFNVDKSDVKNELSSRLYNRMDGIGSDLFKKFDNKMSYDVFLYKDTNILDGIEKMLSMHKSNHDVYNRNDYVTIDINTFGVSNSARWLCRLLNEKRDNNLRKRVTKHINNYFKRLRKYNSVSNKAIRKSIGELLIDELRNNYATDWLYNCDEKIRQSIYTVKLVYIRDLFIHAEPIDYKNSKNVKDGEDKSSLTSIGYIDTESEEKKQVEESSNIVFLVKSSWEIGPTIDKYLRDGWKLYGSPMMTSHNNIIQAVIKN